MSAEPMVVPLCRADAPKFEFFLNSFIVNIIGIDSLALGSPALNLKARARLQFKQLIEGIDVEVEKAQVFKLLILRVLTKNEDPLFESIDEKRLCRCHIVAIIALQSGVWDITSFELI
jgi:hypothetical protein